MVNVVLSLPSPASPLLRTQKRRRNSVYVCVFVLFLQALFTSIFFCPEGWGALIHSHLSEILCFARSRARILASGCDMNNYYFGWRMEIKDLKRMAGSATAGWDRKRCGLLSASCWLSGDSLLARVSIIVGLGEYTNSTNFLPILGAGPTGGMKKTPKHTNKSHKFGDQWLFKCVCVCTRFMFAGWTNQAKKAVRHTTFTF